MIRAPARLCITQEVPITFAEVVVFSPLDAPTATFTYHAPETLAGRLTVGSLVVVPFGARRLYGVVISVGDEPPARETRPVESLADPQPVLTPTQIALARWLSDAYLAPPWRCLAMMLPPGLVGHADVEVSLAPAAQPSDALTPPQEQLFRVLDARGVLRGRQLDRLLPREQWRRAAAQLARRGVVIKSPFLAPPRARPRQVRTVEWIAADDAPLAGLKSELYPAIVEFLRAAGGPVDVSWVYAETGCTRYHLDKLAERGLVAFDAAETWRDPLADELFAPDTPPVLTPEQQAVWDAIKLQIANCKLQIPNPQSPIPNPQSQITNPQSQIFLLRGETGSGKTEIYLRAVEETLARGGQAIVLVPEIGLTPQMAHRFGARLGRRIAVFHSALTPGQQYDAWRRARAGQVDVVIGPRSALFMPLPRLGLIVVDEEHDASYKQEEVFIPQGDRLPPEPLLPYYHARDAALQLASLTGAAVILGSATPSLESYQRARGGDFTLLEMPRRVVAHTRRLQDLQARYGLTGVRYWPEGASEARSMPPPAVQIVDLRAELRAGNRSIFSRALQRALEEALKRGEQAVLFLNRRGAATFVLCRDCGYAARCPRCDAPLTYHGAEAELVCHHCGERAPQPERCPQCGGKRIRYFGLGTEQVEQAVHERWPDARTLRWDSDAARYPAAHAAILDMFNSGLAHILVGTQMVARGLDLPRVSLVGVISADGALNLPDFRAGERTFQLLTHVIALAGRGLRPGRAVVQTYHPDHYAIVAAAAHDYERFAAQELAFRREHGYPPFRRLAKLIYEDASLSAARAEAESLAETLRAEMARRGSPSADLLGPVPAFHARLHGRYRWQILLRHFDPPELLRAVRIPPGWRVDVDPVGVL